MSMKVGTLTSVVRDGRVIGYRGQIATPGFAEGVRFVPNEHRGRSSNAPAFKIEMKFNGRPFETGAAWIKKSPKVKGGEFLTITLMNTALPKPIYLRAFPADEQPDGVDDLIEWNVVFQSQATPGPAANRAAPMPDPNDPDDDIPF